MASSPRLIDKLPTVPRKTEMKVLGLGLSRTGTDSLKTALNELGYDAYHMYEVITLKHGRYWTEAMDANLASHTINPPYGRAEFDKLLHGFDAVLDMPMALFVDDFMAAYPDAKVVVTVRDFDSWEASLHRTLFPIFASKAWDMLYPFDWHGFGDMRRSGRQSFVQLAANGEFMDIEQLRLGFEAHHARVRAVVPTERLLEFRSQDGWEPLCKFLGKDIPTMPYPRTNDASSFMAFVNKMFVFKFAEAVFEILLSGGVMAILLAVIWSYLPKGIQS